MAASSFPTDRRLAVIARMGVGYDTIDLDACTAADVALTITPDAVRRPMATTQLCFILALAHNLVAKDRIARIRLPFRLHCQVHGWWVPERDLPFDFNSDDME